MSVQAAFRSALTAMQTAFADASVTVVSNGQSGTGLKETVRSPSSLVIEGERGEDTGTVRVSAADMSTPKDGGTIIVDGDKATVTATRLDSVGAILTIEYMLQKPVTLEDLT
jgi:hypothetical protein